AKKFQDIRRAGRLDPEGRAQASAERRAMADVLTLAALREARGLTQTAVAQALEVSQPNVARIEGREDHYLSTLSEYIAALGGHLELTAVFPDQRISLIVPATERAEESMASAVIADD